MRLLLPVLPLFAYAQDPYCSAYPPSARAAAAQSLQADRAYQARSKVKRAANLDLPRASFVDSFLFDKMAADGVTPAPVTNDAEFLRRVSLDLTGRIPSAAATDAFLKDEAPGKRAALIERLLASDAYVSQWTLYFGNRLRVTRGGGSRLGVERRNAWARYLRDFVQRDRPYDAFVREILTASGDADTNPQTAFLVQVYSNLNNGPAQDYYDNLTDLVTTQFLGFKTNCVSCHNGRGYLEKINLYLVRKRRSDFWNTAAFFSRLQVNAYSDRDFSVYRFFLQDRDSGTYVGTVNPDNPGQRPPRVNAAVETPSFLLNEATPSTGAWRQEFVKMVTEDRQFARAAVNYLWAAMFRTGIVDPPDAWDFNRTDPTRPPPGDWPMQNSHPELLEALADYFMQNNYSVKAVLRLLANSTAYQLASRYEGPWSPDYARYFARHEPRRLAAEEIYDAVTTATQTETPIMVHGYDQPFYYANDLPDAAEPTLDWRAAEMLRQFGRGNWMDTDRDNSPTLLGLLYAMNGWEFAGRTSEATWLGNTINRVSRVAAMDVPDEEAIRQMYLATLTREPSAAELETILARRRGQTRTFWLSKLQWALLNKLDFIFNY